MAIFFSGGREPNQPLPSHLNALFTVVFYECHEYGFLSCVKESSSEMINVKVQNL